jgi:hypothetical protein
MDVLHFVNQPVKLAVSGMSEIDLQRRVPQGKTVEIFNELHERGRKMTAPSGNTVQASDDAVQVEESECCCYVIDGEHDFKRLCQKFDNIHWLHCEENSFVWKRSKGDMNLLRNHVSVGTSYSNLETVMELPQQVVLLISGPGMGKSTELSHLASVIKGADPNTCVVRINLNDHTNYLNQDEPSALELLCIAGRFDTHFPKYLLEKILLPAGNTVLLFDGFYEISPQYSDKVLSIVMKLRAMNVRKVCHEGKTRESIFFFVICVEAFL